MIKKHFNNRSYKNRNIWSGFLFGIGFAAFIDEAVFHQLLGWHHFYDKSTTTVGLISDGLFHAFSWFATIGGLFLFADLRRWQEVVIKKWWGFVFIGYGVFQLYDGIIHHKLMRVHQIRYVENVWVYDLFWNMIAIILLVFGLYLVRTTVYHNGSGEGK